LVSEARAKLNALISRRASNLHRQGQTELAQQFRAAAEELWTPAAERELAEMKGVVFGDVDAKAVLEGLVDIGLIVPGADIEKRVEERAEELAHQRLEALRQEHGIPA
jgi:hypothetical protein